MSGNKKVKFGFTLAEVLITLGIIGIIAAMTIPALIGRWQEKQTVVKLKKFYNTLSQAYIWAVEKNGTPDLWGAGDRDSGDDSNEDYVAESAKQIEDILFENVKVLAHCDRVKDKNKCNLADKYYFHNGTVDTGYKRTTALSLIDGSSVLVIGTSGNCTNNRGTGKHLQNVCTLIYYDINGAKSPNMFGKDFFAFYLTKYGIIPAGTESETFWPFNDSGNRWVGKAAWVIYNENMDYLHCDDLSWSGKHKCK